MAAPAPVNSTSISTSTTLIAALATRREAVAASPDRRNFSTRALKPRALFISDFRKKNYMTQKNRAACQGRPDLVVNSLNSEENREPSNDQQQKNSRATAFLAALERKAVCA